MYDVLPDGLAVERSVGQVPASGLLSGKTISGVVTSAAGSVAGGLWRPAGVPLYFADLDHSVPGRWIATRLEHTFDRNVGYVTHFEAKSTPSR